MCGDPSVGKTSFLSRYTRNVVTDNPNPTLGVEYSTKCILLRSGDGIVKANIWDTAGSERYKSITTAYIFYVDITGKQ
jgi:Rab family protein